MTEFGIHLSLIVLRGDISTISPRRCCPLQIFQQQVPRLLTVRPGGNWMIWNNKMVVMSSCLLFTEHILIRTVAIGGGAILRVQNETHNDNGVAKIRVRRAAEWQYGQTLKRKMVLSYNDDELLICLILKLSAGCNFVLFFNEDDLQSRPDRTIYYR